jgi:hypothetical protein
MRLKMSERRRVKIIFSIDHFLQEKKFRKNNSYYFSFLHQTVFNATPNALTVGQMTLDQMTI